MTPYEVEALRDVLTMVARVKHEMAAPTVTAPWWKRLWSDLCENFKSTGDIHNTFVPVDAPAISV